ncbi:MAG: SPOR domain-containing protein [Prevotellaceae bacterium]|jgi:nucleoid DNA-binding protein|nr:SPOR domain-containing protein [Prevotellaceae bacterium]
MEEIAELLIELLKKHNRVSLPSMGAFVASPQPAVIEKNRIIPPSKKVVFQKSEVWNDGLLEHLYAERYGLSVEDAREKLYRIIADIRFELDATGKVTLSGLGTLKQTPSRDVSFGLAKKLNLQEDSFGLDEVSIASKAEGGGAKKAGATGKTNNVPLFVLFCVMLATISALTLFFFLNRIRSKDNIEALITEQDEPQTDFPTDLPKQKTLDLGSRTVSQLAPEETPVEVHPQQPAQPKVNARALEEKPRQKATTRCEFCTVVASFNTREGARVKAQRYKNMGYNARVIDGENNRYRVALGCYPTHEAAKQGLVEAAKFVNDAWILEVCR